MNENGNSAQTGVATPPMPPAPPTSAPPTPNPGMPGQPKQKLDVLMFILGLISPGVLLGLMGLLSTVLQSDLLVFLTQGIAGLFFFAFVAAFAAGKAKQDRRMWSFGLGGMAAYAFGGLLLLLAFGTCLVALSTSGL